MARPVRIPAQQEGFEKSVMDAVNRLNRSGQLKLNVNSRSFTQPLGKITASADEFTKSLEASNARVIAFGASVGIINAVSNAFKSLVVQTIQVQKQMAEINVVMQTGTAGLQQMQTGLFKIAKETAQSFSVVTEAALEFSRQGLSMEKTLLATKQAMILTRITALDAADAVKGLTAAVNGFVDAGINHTQVVNKMSAVDVSFAVSTEDLIHGLERAGAVAQDAKVSFDELMGAITAAQQITARGGNVIGNSFKTIFTRIQRSSTINRLEELGIAVKDLEGRTLPAMKILKELALTYDGLADSTKAAVAEQVGGVFQINILKAALKDLGRENSVFARATEISNRATDEATKKNEALNKTLSALADQTGTSIQQLSEAIGKLSMGGGIEKVLKTINTLAEGMFKGIESEGIGGDLARGLLKGMGNILSGPGLILIGGMFVKLFGEVSKFATKSMANIIGITTQKQKQKAVEEAILKVMMENESVEASLLAMGKNRVLQEEHVLKLIKQQAAAARERAAIATAVAPGLVRSGVKGPNLTLKGGAAGGIIPASQKNAERKGAISAGYSPGKISSTKIKGVGDVVYNKAESIKQFPGMQQKAIMPPESSRAGSKYAKAFKKAHGFDPYAPSGFIPNYGIIGARGSASLNLSKTNMVTHGTGGGQNTRAMDKKYGESGEKLFATETARFVNRNTPEEKRSLLGRIMTRLLDKGIVTFTRPGYFQKESFKTNRRSSEKDFDQFERHMVKQLSSEGYKSTGRVIDPKRRLVEAGNNQYPQDAFAKGKVPREFKINRIDEKDILSKSIRRTTDLDPQDILNGKYARGDITKGNEFVQVLRNNFGPSSGNHDEILMGLVSKFEKSNLDSALNLLRQKNINVPAGEEAYTAAIHGLHKGFIPNYGMRRNLPSAHHFEKAKKSIGIYKRLPDTRKRLKDYDGTLAQEISDAWGLKDPLYTTIVKTFGKVKGRGTTKTVNEDVLDIMTNPEKYKAFPMPNGQKVNLFEKHSQPAPSWSARDGKEALKFFSTKGKFGSLDKVKMGQKSKIDGMNWEGAVKSIFKNKIKSGEVTDFNTIRNNFPLDFKGKKGFFDATLGTHKLKVMLHKIARTLAHQNPSKLKDMLLKGKDFDGVRALGGLAEISKSSSGIRDLSRMIGSRSLFPEGKFVKGTGSKIEDFSQDMQKWYDSLSASEKTKVRSAQMSGSWKVQSPEEYQLSSGGFVPNFLRMINPSKDRRLLLRMWQDKLKKAKSIYQSGRPRIETDPQVSKLNGEANEIWDQIQLLKKGKPYSIPNFANISKIRELAKRGKGGEKANAQRMLEKFSIRSKGMFDDMIIDDFLRDPNMTYKGPWGDTVTDYLLRKGYDKNQILKAAKSPSSYTRAAGGHVPNFSNPLSQAISREKAAGVPENMIRISRSDRLKGPQNPSGLAVINTRDEPMGVNQGINRSISMGIDPKKHGAAKGFTPNFVSAQEYDDILSGQAANVKVISPSPATPELSNILDKIGLKGDQLVSVLDNLEKPFNDFRSSLNTGGTAANQHARKLTSMIAGLGLEESQTKKLMKEFSNLGTTANNGTSKLKTFINSIGTKFRQNPEGQGISKVMQHPAVQATVGSGGMFSMFNQGLQGNVTPSTSRAGRAGQSIGLIHGKVSNPGMQMGMMMAPMMTEMMAETIRGGKPKYERSQASRAATGAISGLGDVAMYTAMGSMFGPLGTAIGATVGATIALTKVFKEASLSLEDIQQRNASYAAEMQKVTGSIQGYEKSVAAVNQARKSGNFNAAIRASQNEMRARSDLRLSMGSDFSRKYTRETDQNKKAELALKAFDAQSAVSALAASEELIKGVSEIDLTGLSTASIRRSAGSDSEDFRKYQSAENSIMRAGQNLQSLESILDKQGQDLLKAFFSDSRFNQLATGTDTGPMFSNKVAEDMAEELKELMLRLQGNIDDDIGGENLALIQKQLKAFADTIGNLDESDEIQATFGNLKKGIDLRAREEIDLRSKHTRNLMQEFNRFEKQLSIVFADITHQFKSLNIIDGAISAGQKQSAAMTMRSIESTGIIGQEDQAILRGNLESNQIDLKKSQEIGRTRREAQLKFSKGLEGKNFSETLTGSLADPNKTGKTLLPKIMGEFLKDASNSIEDREKLIQGEITDGFKNFVAKRTVDLDFTALESEIEDETFGKINEQINKSARSLKNYNNKSMFIDGPNNSLSNTRFTDSNQTLFQNKTKRNTAEFEAVNYFTAGIEDLVEKSLKGDFKNANQVNQVFDDFIKRGITEKVSSSNLSTDKKEIQFGDILNEEVNNQIESIRDNALDKVRKISQLEQIKSMLDPSSDGFPKDVKGISNALKTTDVGKELFKSFEDLKRVESLLKQRMSAEEALLKQQTEFAIAQGRIMDASQAQIREAQRSLSRVELNDQGQFVNKGIEAEKRALKAANARELEMAEAQANFNNIGLTSGSKEFLTTRAVEDKRKLQEPELIAKETKIASEKINQLFTPEKYATLLPPALELREVAKERLADLNRQKKENEKNIEIFKESFKTVMGVAEDAKIEDVKNKFTQDGLSKDKRPSQAQTDAYNNLINAESTEKFLAEQTKKVSEKAIREQAGGPSSKLFLGAMNSYQQDINAYNDSFDGISEAFKNAPRDNEKDLSAAVEGLKASISEEILKFYSKDTAFGTKDEFKKLLNETNKVPADRQALQVANKQFQSNKEAFITKDSEGNPKANMEKLGEKFEDMFDESTRSIANLRDALQEAGKDALTAEKAIAKQRVGNDKAAIAATKLAARTRSVADSMTDLGSALSHINELSLQFIQASLDTDMGEAGMTSSQVSKRQRDFDLMREVSQGRDQLQRQSKEATSSFISQIQGLDIDDSIKTKFLDNFDNKETKAGIVNSESFKTAANNVLENTNFLSKTKSDQGALALGNASPEDVKNFANNNAAQEALRAEIEKSTNTIKLNEQTIGREVSYRQRLNSLLDQNARYMQSFGAGVSGAMSSIKERLENFRRTEGETLVSSMNEGFKRNAMGDYGEGESFFSIINDRNREIVAQRNADSATNIVFGNEIGKTLEAFGVKGASEKYDMGKFWDPEGNEQKRANEKMLTSFNETGSLGDNSLDFLRSDLLSSKDIQAVTADNTRKMVELLQSMKEQGLAGGNMGDGSTAMGQEAATKEGQQRTVATLNNQTKQDATNTDTLANTVAQSSSDSAGVISSMLGSAIGTIKTVGGINNDVQSGQWGDAGKSIFDGARAAGQKVGEWLDDDDVATSFRGGYISRFNSGGRVSQFGGDHNTDNVPALLTGGEYVIRKDSVEKYGKDYFEKLNKGLIPKKFEDGGDVKKAEKSWFSKKISKMTSNFSNEMNQFEKMRDGMEADKGTFASMFGSGQRNRRSSANMGMTRNADTGSFWTQENPVISKDDFGNDVVALNSDGTGPAETKTGVNWGNVGNAAVQGANLVGNVAKGYQNYKQGKENRAAQLAKARAEENEKRRKRDYQLLKPLEYYDMAATQIDLGGLSGKSSIDQGRLRLSAAAMTGQIQGDRYGTLLVNVQKRTHENKINDRLFDIEYAKQAAYAKAVDKYEKKKMIADSLIQVGGAIASFAGAGEFMKAAGQVKDFAGGAQALFGVQDRSQMKPASLKEVMKQAKERRKDFSGPAMDIHQYGSLQRLQQRYANVKSGSTSGADLYLGGFELTQPGQRVRNPSLYGKTKREREGKFSGGLIRLAGGGTVNYDASRVTRSSNPDVAGSDRSGRVMTGYDTKGRDIYNSFAMGGQVPTLQKKDISIGHDLIDRIATPDNLNLNLDDFEVQEIDNAFQLPDSIINSVSNKGSAFNPAIIATMAKGFDYLASRKQKGGDITSPLDPMGMLTLALGGVVNSSKSVASSILGLAKGGSTDLKIKPSISAGSANTNKNINLRNKGGNIASPYSSIEKLALAIGGVVNSSKAMASSVLGLSKGGFADLKIEPDPSTGVTAHLLSTYKNSNRHGKAGADSIYSQLESSIKTAGLKHNNQNQTTGRIQKSHILSEKSLGGPIELQALTKYSSGGNVTGGSGVRDDVPALLSEGEYVIRKSSAQKYGSNFLDQLNAGTKAVSRFAEGGAVGEAESSPSISESKEITHNVSQNFTFNISKDGSSSENEEGDDMSENEREKEFGRRVRVACLKVIEEERRIGGLLH